jgi:hypothetical protein
MLNNAFAEGNLAVSGEYDITAAANTKNSSRADQTLCRHESNP